MSEDKATKPRKCIASEVLGAALMRMLQANPKSPVFRALVMQRTLRPIPKTRTTYDAIIEWVETTIEASKAVIAPPVNRPPPNAHGVTNNGPQGISVRINLIGYENGRCNYTATAYANGDVHITMDDILRVADDADNEEEFNDLITDLVNDRSRQNISGEDNEDFDYDDHEAEETRYDEWHWRDDQSKDTLLQACWRALREADERRYNRVVHGEEDGEGQ